MFCQHLPIFTWIQTFNISLEVEDVGDLLHAVFHVEMAHNDDDDWFTNVIQFCLLDCLFVKASSAQLCKRCSVCHLVRYSSVLVFMLINLVSGHVMLREAVYDTMSKPIFPLN